MISKFHASAGITEEKQRRRTLIRDLFRGFDADSRAVLDREINARLADLFLPETGILLGYSALNDEPDVRPFLGRWLAAGRRLALPAWLEETRLVPREAKDIDSGLLPGRGGILEPESVFPDIFVGDVSAILVPGRAFSENLGRLGRGLGCYDRMLASCAALKIGVAYDFQVFQTLPLQGNDIRMDMIVTPGRVIGKGAICRKP